MKRAAKYGIGILLIMLTMAGCGSSSQDIDVYNETVREELARGTRNDNLFLGVRFGMTSKQFFGYCWELNRKGIITDGANNTAVLYKIDKGLKYPASMNFYPEFHLNKLYKMKATFQYNAWAPWNKSHFSDSLLTDVMQLFKQWYGGNGFMKITDPVKGTIFVKVDANRRLTIGRFDDMTVKADLTDLYTEQKLTD